MFAAMADHFIRQIKIARYFYISQYKQIDKASKKNIRKNQLGAMIDIYVRSLFSKDMSFFETASGKKLLKYIESVVHVEKIEAPNNSYFTVAINRKLVDPEKNELNIEKTVSSNGVNCYAKAEKVHTVKFHNIISEAVVNIDYAMNIVSIKCHSGLANAACAGLDMMNLSYVVGTIAGDDTIFVLTRTEGDARMLTRHLKELL